MRETRVLRLRGDKIEAAGIVKIVLAKEARFKARQDVTYRLNYDYQYLVSKCDECGSYHEFQKRRDSVPNVRIRESKETAKKVLKDLAWHLIENPMFVINFYPSPYEQKMSPYSWSDSETCFVRKELTDAFSDPNYKQRLESAKKIRNDEYNQIRKMWNHTIKRLGK